MAEEDTDLTTAAMTERTETPSENPIEEEKLETPVPDASLPVSAKKKNKKKKKNKDKKPDQLPEDTKEEENDSDDEDVFVPIKEKLS